jgi:hypothetical protein
MKINYSKFCYNPEKYLKKIQKFLKIQIDQDLKKLETKNVHVPSGNIGTKTQIIDGFSGVKYDDSWKKRLNKYQKTTLKLFNYVGKLILKYLF